MSVLYQCIILEYMIFITLQYIILTNCLCPFADGPLKVEISGLYFHPVDLTVSMECSADSRPECDFYWFLDNESSAVIHTGSVITLIATKLSQGNYICVAKNPVTNITMYKTKEYVIGE